SVLVPLVPVSRFGEQWEPRTNRIRLGLAGDFVDDMVERRTHVVDRITGREADPGGDFFMKGHPEEGAVGLAIFIAGDLIGLAVEELAYLGIHVRDVLLRSTELEQGTGFAHD